MKFGSWTYDGNKINLTLLMDVIDLSTYQLSGEWDLIGMDMKCLQQYTSSMLRLS